MPEGSRRPDRGLAPVGVGWRVRRVRRAPAGRRSLNDAVVAAASAWGATIESWATADFSSVAYVRLPSGGAVAVAKLPPDEPDCVHEGDALAAWDGRGAVRLLDRSSDGVLLLERAVPGTAVTDDAELGAAVALLWIDPPASVPWRRFDVVADGWRASIERWRSVLGDAVVDGALAAEQVLLDGDRSGWRLLHGDGHHGNVLDGGDRGWLAIDPQPLVGPPVYDLATAVWNGPDLEVDVEARMAGLADAAGVPVDQLRTATRYRSALSVAWDLDGDGPDVLAGGGVPARSLAVARALTTVPDP